MNVRQIAWEGVGGLKEFNPATCLVQLKYDGSQYHLHIANGRAYALTSKRVSVKTGKLNDKIDNFPELKRIKFPFAKETIIVCEVVAEHLKDVEMKDRCGFVAGIMNSLPENVPTPNPLRLVAHDIILHNGIDTSSHAYHLRYSYLKYFPDAGFFGEQLHRNGAIIYRVTNKKVRDEKEYEDLFKEVVADNFEGLIVRHSFGSETMKLKRELTADCIIIGYKDGTGKYEGLVGAIQLGVFKKVSDVVKKKRVLTGNDIDAYLSGGELVDVGYMSGFTDDERKMVTRNRQKLLGRIVEVTYMNWTGKKMRHPRNSTADGAIRFRDDKPLHRCTISQFGNDMPDDKVYFLLTFFNGEEIAVSFIANSLSTDVVNFPMDYVEELTRMLPSMYQSVGTIVGIKRINDMVVCE